MFFAELELGSLVLDINGNVLQAAFLRETGAMDDYFTIIKGGTEGGFGDVTLELANGTQTLRWQSRSDRYYQVERATALAPANWSILATALPGTGAAMTWSS